MLRHDCYYDCSLLGRNPLGRDLCPGHGVRTVRRRALPGRHHHRPRDDRTRARGNDRSRPHVLAAAKGGKVFAALGLLALFASGTFICVTGSAGRSAEVSQKKEAEAKKVNGGRDATEADLKKAKAERGMLSTNASQQCASGPGPRCKGARALLEMADSHIAILQVRLDDMRPSSR